MATSGIVNASACDKQDRNEPQDRPKKFFFGVFFDGTSNNMVQKKAAEEFRKKSKNKDEWELEVVENNNASFMNGANQIPKTESGAPAEGYSNVAILHSFYQSMSQEEFENCKSDADTWIFNIYVEGAGTDAIYDGGWIDKAYNWKGSVKGTGHSGVSKLVCKAVAMVRERLKAVSESDYPDTEVHFDVFGFSRGATCARLFSYLALREGTSQNLNCESEFEGSMADKYYENNFLHFLDTLGLKSVTVDFLGIYDTVSSIGGISADSYANNVKDYGLHSPAMDKVLNTFHLCAMDEFREHFALTDIGSACDKGGNAEIFMPGCHSDVGGGYKTKKYSFALYADDVGFAEKAIDKPSDTLLPVNRDNLMKLGWCTEKDSCWLVPTPAVNPVFYHIHVSRMIESGYSNIPLTMMKNRSETKLGRQSFKDISQLYPIDNKFSAWSGDLLGLAKSASGREWYYPGGSYSSPSYRLLRNYLHFSSTESLGFTPSYYNKKQICRYIYHSDGDSKRTYTNIAY